MDLVKRFELLHEKARQELSGAAKTAPPEMLSKILSRIEECARAGAQLAELERLASRLETGAPGKQYSLLSDRL